MKDYNEIQCPNCGGKIIIDVKVLIGGGSFSCSNPNCGASISLSRSSHQAASNAMREFEQLRRSHA